MKPVDIQIRPAAIDDTIELREISIKTFQDAFGSVNTEQNMQQYIDHFFSISKLETELSDPGSQFYFAMKDGRAVGYLKLNLGNAQTEMREDNGVEVERIYVDKDLQGNNIGQLLFDLALQIAHERHAQYLWLGVWEKNPGAIRFYERNGLSQFSTHPFKLGDDLQTDIMMKIEFI